MRRNKSTIDNLIICCIQMGRIGVFIVLVSLLLQHVPCSAQEIDICGCSESNDSLGDFNSVDENTWPSGTTRSGDAITIPLPDDGILIFDSFTVNGYPGFPTGNATIRFELNEANTPVTLLVNGDVEIDTNDSINVNGENGRGRIGGMGGPGGFRGGDGAYQLMNFANDGGTGFGPGGGSGGKASDFVGDLDPFGIGGDGTFIGMPELLPMFGGSGGGGGSSSTNEINCSGGGGGGGGGAILIAANGSITVNGNIFTTGGGRGQRGLSACSTSGGPGSGGAIRLIAKTITGNVNGRIEARNGANSTTDGLGIIRMESFANDFPDNRTIPVATRSPSLGPLTNPLTPEVRITHLNDDNDGLVPEIPLGGFGEVDVIMTSPGPLKVDLETKNVPDGTTVEVSVKPHVGGTPKTQSVTLDNCANGECTVSTNFASLDPGKYIIEARATFQTP